jgi:hypothetical protein
MTSPPGATYATVMAVLLALFLARVIGQIVAATIAPPWLPPMSRWYSGLMPYRFLLPAQIVFLAVMTALTIAVWLQRSPLGTPAPAAAVWVLWASYAYAAGMTVRLVRYLRAAPERRGVLIPIIFHYVLAAFVFTYGRALAR